jgi:hypothetical protein
VPDNAAFGHDFMGLDASRPWFSRRETEVAELTQVKSHCEYLAGYVERYDLPT